MKVTAIHNQSLLDVSLQEYGSLEQLLSIAVLNNLSLTDMLEAGSVLQLEDTAEGIQKPYFKRKQIWLSSYIDAEPSNNGGVYVITPINPKSLVKRVIADQSVLDIALQESGGIESLFEVCQLNNWSITQVLEPTAVIAKGTTVIDTDIFTYYTNKNIKPATSYTEAAIVEEGYTVPLYVLENYWV